MQSRAPQVTGFFSKEKLSWDNNNLACILVFPPWQRKGLGALLMGVSYEISKREGILGGPEKPISDLGKKGYKRFWSGEVARWLLSLENAAPQGQTAPQELIVDVNDCSQGTWIVVEDCLSVLQDMSVVEDAGMGYGKPEKQTVQENGQAEDVAEGEANATPEEKPTAPPIVKLVPRVRVDKEAVRRYVATHRLTLERACDPTGFIEGYAIKDGSESGLEESESG